MNVEHQCAVAFMVWWSYAHRRAGVPEHLLHAIPNAGGYKGGYQSNARRVVAMKREGVRPGVSDYFLAVPRGPFHGLYLELKAGGPGITPGRVSPDQRAFGESVTAQGYRFDVCFGSNHAIDAVEKYLSLPPPPAPPAK